MSKRKRKKISLIRVYVARTIALFIVSIMLTLMICGCLYIKEHWFNKDESTPTDQKVEENLSEEAPPVEETLPEILQSADSTKYAGFAVMIDPGHGGNDGGTSSGDIIEKDINLRVSQKLTRILEAYGIEVFHTRVDDDYVSLEERAYKSNQTPADFFVSVHCNYFEEDTTITGFETFYPRNREADLYAENIAKAAEETGMIDVRGAKENNYYVTRKVEADAILIEMGFLSNPDECSKLASDEYQEILAESIAKGIFATFDTKK